MDKMAAALDKPNATTTLPTSPSNTAPATPQTATPPAAASNATADPSLRSKRGFDLKDWSNEMVFVLVKADVAKTADALAKAWEAKVVKDVLGKPINDDIEQTVVYQLAGHPWSVFACEGRELESFTAALSRDADVLVVWNSDFTAWSGIDLFRGGQEVEALHWGGVGERIGEEADAAKWHAKAEVTRQFEGEPSTDAFQFRSTLHKGQGVLTQAVAIRKVAARP